MLVGEHDDLDAVAEAELGEDPGDVGLHGRLADEECRGDLGVGVAGGDTDQHLALALGQLVQRRWWCRRSCATGELFDHSPGHCGIDQAGPGSRRPDCAHQVLGSCVLEQEAAGPGAECVVDMGVDVERRQDHHA